MTDYMVFETEYQVDVALARNGRKYKLQRTDGKWITTTTTTTPPEGYPSHTVESELLSWYEEGSKQYDVLKSTITTSLNQKFEIIDAVYEEVKREFTSENIIMGITQMGKTVEVLNALEKLDYCLRSRSIDAMEALFAEIPRSEPFLTEERLTAFKNRIYQRLAEEGAI